MRKLGFLTVVIAASWMTIGGLSAQGPNRVDVLILFKQRQGQGDLAAVRGAGATIKYNYNIVNAVSANLPERAIAGLANNPNIEIVELDGVATINRFDAELDNTWGVKKIGAGDAHALPTPVLGTAVNVAVIDTGTTPSHPELAGAYRGGWDFVNNDSDPTDDNGHGTHVSGTIAAAMNGTGVVGVAPGVNLYALKVLNAQGSGSYSNIIAAVDWATSHNIQVTNNSYGGTAGSATMEQAFRNAALAGVVSVAAAGNSGACNGSGDSVGYPGKYVSVIAVAATDTNDVRACFSSTGPRVEIAAPGVNINSTVMSGGYESNWSGTSMATPHVTGAAALLYGRGVADSNANGRINDEIRNVLAQTALDLGTAGRDTGYGFGRVRVMNSLNAGPVAPMSGVSGIDFQTASGKNKDMIITVSAVYKPVVPDAGANVSVTITVNGAIVSSSPVTTDADGDAVFIFRNAPSGTWRVIVNNITGGGLNFDGVTPANSYVKR
jgi:subtilisin